MHDNAYEYDQRVVEFMFNQHTTKQALKLWGKDTTVAAEEKMKQLLWRKSFQPVHWSELSPEQRTTILESHIFVQKKRTGEIQARMVAGGNRQCGYIDKEDASSPMVATKSVLLSCIIDAKEGRTLLLLISLVPLFIVRMRGEVVDILC